MTDKRKLDVDALAAGFYALLAADLSAEEMHAVRRRNARYALAGSDSCASHEFCDANMTMLETWKAHFEREPVFLMHSESAAGQAEMALWGEAWAKARKEALTDPDAEKARLGAEYVALIGYDPFEDDPTQSAADVAEILAGYRADRAAEAEEAAL